LRGELREQRPEAWRVAHRRLYEHLCATTKDKAQPSGPRSKTGELHLIVDSVGLKLREAGEWLFEEHGTSKRRSWRKFHIGIDADSDEIVAFDLTDKTARRQVVRDRDSDPVGICQVGYADFVAQAAKMGELHSNLAKAAFKPAEQAIAAIQGTK